MTGIPPATVASKKAKPSIPQSGEKTVIVGGRGRMGKMLLQKSEEKGIKAISLDRPLEEEKIKIALKDAKLVILSIPARKIRDVLQKIIPFLPENCILSDIVSVKEQPMKLMEEYWTGPTVGSHPLFGPAPDWSTSLPVALVRGRNASQNDYDSVANFFEKLGFQTFETTASEHDQAMAKIQNMNFITNLAYFAALANQKELLPFLTPSFERRRKAAQKMLTEDAEMFSGLFESNPHSHEAVRQFRKMLNIAASGDVDLLCRKAQWWWPKA